MELFIMNNETACYKIIINTKTYSKLNEALFLTTKYTEQVHSRTREKLNWIHLPSEEQTTKNHTRTKIRTMTIVCFEHWAQTK